MRPLRMLTALAITLSLVTLSGTARAAEVAPAPQVQAPVVVVDTVWYGTYSLLLDGIALYLVTNEGEHRTGFVWSGLAIYAFGAPMVHAANGQYWRAAGSAAARIGVPLAAYGLTRAALGRENDFPIDLPVLAAVSATIVTMGFDDLWMSRKTRYVERAWTPTLAPTASGGLTLGLAGCF